MCPYDTSGNPSFKVKRAWVDSMADHMFTESKGVTPKEAAKAAALGVRKSQLPHECERQSRRR